MMKKILVVDDNRDILELINIVLTEDGFKVRTIDDTKSIFRDLESFNPDLILMDIRLNGIDGREVCRTVKASPEGKDIPVIMISASDTMYENGKPTCPAQDFIAKPFDIDTLIYKINRLVVN